MSKRKDKPTPGPWGFYPSYTGEEGTFEVGPEAYETVAHVRHGCLEVKGSCEANARLIAAAPDHHAAAVEIDRWALVIESAVRSACGRGSRDHEAVVAALKANMDAVAKARGTVTTSMSPT